MSPSTDLQKGLPYRRRLFAARHRKRSPLVRLLRPFLGAMILVGSPAALTAWVLTSPEFTLQKVSISGAVRVPEAWVEAELEALRGFQLFDIPADLIEGRLASHHWIKTVRVRKRLPDEIHVELIERRPVAVLQNEGDLSFVDPDGVVFADFDPTVGASDLLILSGSTKAHELQVAMRVALVVERIAPEWGSTLSEVEILSNRDFRLYSAALPFPLVVSGEHLEAGLESLRDRLPEIEPHLESIGALDLRFDRYIVVQPGKER